MSNNKNHVIKKIGNIEPIKQIKQGINDVKRDNARKGNEGVIKKISNGIHKEPEEHELIQRLIDEKDSEKKLKKGRPTPRKRQRLNMNDDKHLQKIVIMTEDETIRDYANLLRDDLIDLEMMLEAEQPEEEGRNEYKSGAEESAPAGHQWVYVFVVNSGTPASKVIKAYSKKPYSHASISFDKSLTNMGSFDLRGFKRENIKTYRPDANFSLYKIAVPNEAAIVMKDAVRNIELCKDEHYRYSVKGLLGFVFKRHSRILNNDKYKLFCSQFVARMFATAGLQVFGDRPDYTIHPYDFTKNKNFKFCYKGVAKNYDPSKVR